MIVPMKPRKKILIIGGGISGLAAADRLSRSMDVTLLEGRDRLGGRIHTDRSWDYPIDLGAQVIHGFQKNPITALAKKQRLKTLVSGYSDYYLYGPGGEKIDGAWVKEHEKKFETAAGGLPAKLRRLKRDMTVERAVEAALGAHVIPESLLEWFKDSHAIYSGAELFGQSAKEYWQDNEFEGPNKMFPDGYDEILKAFRNLDRVRILMKRRVTQIEWSGQGVKVRTGKELFTADAVLVTLPLGVLQSGNVTFKPALPAWKTRALKRLGMGVLDMIFLEFPKVFWPRDRDFIGVLNRSGEFSRFANQYSIRKIPVLVGLAGGNAARKLEALRTEQIVGRAMQTLKTAFGPGILKPVRSKVTRWASDPFSLGSYSHIPPGAKIGDYDVMAKPAGRTLYFAGEATIAAHPTTVHGAYLSGLREAARILKTLS